MLGCDGILSFLHLKTHRRSSSFTPSTKAEPNSGHLYQEWRSDGSGGATCVQPCGSSVADFRGENLCCRGLIRTVSSLAQISRYLCQIWRKSADKCQKWRKSAVICVKFGANPPISVKNGAIRPFSRYISKLYMRSFPSCNTM